MTGTALSIRVFSRKRETGVVMVECHITPPTRAMAGTTIRAKLSIMLIFGRVAGITTRRRSFINTIGVAGTALSVRMLSGKRETGIVVIKIHITPFDRFVACIALCPKLSIMVILIGMARVTICWRTFIHSVGMA